MTEISDSMKARLPRAVRFHIEKLESDLRGLQNQMAEIISGPDVSNVVLPHYLPDMETQYLPKNTRVHFALQNPRRSNDAGYIAVQHVKGGGINIHGSHPIILEPGASNTCIIKLRDD